jgi:hypothetical protein
MSSRMIAASGAFALSLLAPAAAHALPTIQPLAPCYVTAGESPTRYNSQPLDISVSGFTPNSTVSLSIDGVPVDDGQNLQTDPAGALTVPTMRAPYVASGSDEFTITLTEDGNPANTVSATSKSAALGVRLRPTEARPSQRIRFRGLGFTADKAIYAHYIYRGTVRKTVRMARGPRGDCGAFRARRRQIPVRNPGLGRWTVQFDQSRRFVDVTDPNARPILFVRIGIRLRLVRG